MSNIISDVWIDFFRVIDPPFQGGETFIQSIVQWNQKRGKDFCAAYGLNVWIKENPNENFLQVVFNTIVDGLHDSKLVIRLLKNRKLKRLKVHFDRCFQFSSNNEAREASTG